MNIVITKPINALAFRYVSLGITPTLPSVYLLSYMRMLDGAGGPRSSWRRGRRLVAAARRQIYNITVHDPEARRNLKDCRDGLVVRGGHRRHALVRHTSHICIRTGPEEDPIGITQHWYLVLNFFK